MLVVTITYCFGKSWLGEGGKNGRGKGETKVQEGVEVENTRESRLGKVSAEGGGEDGFVFIRHYV